MTLSQPRVYAGHISADEFDEQSKCVACGDLVEYPVELTGDSYCEDCAESLADEAYDTIKMAHRSKSFVVGELLRAARILSDYIDV